MNKKFNLTLYKHHVLDGGMSQRIYYRVFISGKQYIFCEYGNALSKMKNDFILRTTKLKKNKINTPDILGIYKNGLLLQDLGNNRLDVFFTLNPFAKYLDYCTNIFGKIERIHAMKPLNNSNDTPLAKEENAVFFVNSAYNLLKSNWFDKTGLDKNYVFTLILQAIENIDIKNIKNTYSISDFQSRNIIIQNNEIYFIDYQDIRLLPYEIDYGAFIADPYIDYSIENLIKILICIDTKQYTYNKIIGWATIKLFHALNLYLSQIYGKNNNAYIIPLHVGLKRIEILNNLLRV